TDQSGEETTWLVDLDLEIRAAHRVYLCMGPPVSEDPYLAHARLTPWLARKYRIENADFGGNQVQLCLGTAYGGEAFRSPCLQHEARLALEKAVAWWGERLQVGSLAATALLTDGRLPLSSMGELELEVCTEGTGLCDVAYGQDIPPQLVVDAEPHVCAFRSGRAPEVVLLRVRSRCQDPSLETRLYGQRLPLVLPRPGLGGPEPEAAQDAHVLSCGPTPVALKAWKLHQGEELGCLDFLKRTLEGLDPDVPAILLSPLTHGWSERSSEALQEAARWIQRPAAGKVIIGFPLLTTENLWQWRVRRLRHQYWKLVFSPAEELSNVPGLGPCAVGFGSGTRVASAGVLRALLSNVEEDPENRVNWLLDLDIQIQNAGVQVLSCFSWPMPEADYLQHVALTTKLTEKHQVEMADFDGRRQVLCIKGANWFQVAQKGLVAPYCFRRDVTQAFRRVYGWWTSLDPRNFLVPEEGTFLALFRNGDAGIMPWDSDFDVKLYTEADITMEGFMNRTLEPSFQSMRIEAYAYDGCGQDNYLLLRQANITHHIGDAYVRGSQRRTSHPWRAKLFGVEVSLSPEHLQHIFFTRYRTPVRKLFGPAAQDLPTSLQRPQRNVRNDPGGSQPSGSPSFAVQG
ncbi:unnamed protein product, partial [Effrenium voratum]